ncbi:MAG: hypothetical protein WD929_00110, partial [Steroidobacteraceae bacterium]
AHVVEFEGLDDGGDELHRGLLRVGGYTRYGMQILCRDGVAAYINHLAALASARAPRQRADCRACSNPVPRPKRMTSFTAENHGAATAAQG